MARTSITIVLELDETLDSPVGRACRPDGLWRTFQGWLGLAEAIDALKGNDACSDAASLTASRCAQRDRTERSSSS